MDSFVVFNHENEEFILQNEQIVLNRYHREFGGEKNIEFKTKSDHKHVTQFFSYLQKGEIPNSFEDQIQVFQLLKEWDCHFAVIHSFRYLIQNHNKNGVISHQNQMYPVNIGCFCFQSDLFREFCITNPHEVFEIDKGFSPKSVELFLNLFDYRIKQPEIEYLDEVIEICRFLGCSSLSALINEKSPESVLSLILRKQHEDSFDFSIYEKTIIDDIDLFLSLVDFGQVCLPFLFRVFQKTKMFSSFSLLQSFFEHCVSFHGTKAFILLSIIRFTQEINIEELFKLLSVFSMNHKDDVFSMGNVYFCEYKKQFDLLFQNNNEMKCKIIDLEKKQADDMKQYDFQMEKINEMEVFRQKQDIKIKELEEKIIQEEEQRKIIKQEQRILNAEDQMNEEVEGIKSGKWKTTIPPNFEGNVFIAAATGKLSSIMYLLSNGTTADIYYQNETYDGLEMKNATPLDFSSRYGHLGVVEYLINNGAIINPPEVQVSFNYIVIGSSGAGKTSICHRLVDNKFTEETESTIGVDYSAYITTIEGKRVKMIILDTAGHEMFYTLVRTYFRNAMGVILVFSITDRKSFDQLPKWLRDAKIEADPNFSAILVGNKSELEDERSVSKEEAEKFARENGLDYIETSALRNINVEEIFIRIGLSLIRKTAHNNEKKTPLHYAVLGGHLGIVEYLINHGADINAKSSENMTPFQYAVQNNHTTISEYLIKQGADQP